MMYKMGRNGEDMQLTSSARDRKLILIVEDDFVLRTSLAESLREEGFQVESSASGDEALRRLALAPKPSLILLDLMLPHMDGIQFRIEQGKLPHIADIPVIVITAFDIDPRLKGDLELAQVFRKPLDVPALVAAIAAATAPRAPHGSRLQGPAAPDVAFGEKIVEPHEEP